MAATDRGSLGFLNSVLVVSLTVALEFCVVMSPSSFEIEVLHHENRNVYCVKFPIRCESSGSMLFSLSFFFEFMLSLGVYNINSGSELSIRGRILC